MATGSVTAPEWAPAAPAGRPSSGWSRPRSSAARQEAAEQAENFPVALRLLPAQLRTDLRAVYDVVRTIDDLGDENPDRSAAERTTDLLDFAVDLDALFSGDKPTTPVLAGLQPTLTRRRLPRAPFDQLIEANLADQKVTRYATFSDLLGYCTLSAAPIGALVLALFGQSNPERLALSDRVCAGLQVVEHLQDVAEDRRRGRVYLPQADLVAHGVLETDLEAATSPPQLRRLIRAEAGRVGELLRAGRPLLRSLHGWARIAVAGYLAGGFAALDGLRRQNFDVAGDSSGTRRLDVARHAVGALATTRPGSS